MASSITVYVDLDVFHSEGKQIIWTEERWRGKMPDNGEYDPLLLQKEFDDIVDIHQIFKLEINNKLGSNELYYKRIPVARKAWLYQSLNKFGFVKV